MKFFGGGASHSRGSQASHPDERSLPVYSEQTPRTRDLIIGKPFFDFCVVNFEDVKKKTARRRNIVSITCIRMCFIAEAVTESHAKSSSSFE